MNLQENILWKYLTSVNLALLVIAIIAITSIIGTIIPQGESIGFYAEQFGARNAVLFELLALNNMYSSLWFEALLVVLCANIIACSYNRLPGVLKLIKKDNLSLPIENILKDDSNSRFDSDNNHHQVLEGVKKALGPKSLVIRELDDGKSSLVYREWGAWTRLGAYIVHLSILVIVFGAIFGSLLGYKAFVMLPEGTSTRVVYSQTDNGQSIPLDFEIYCETFNVDYYESGAPKEFRSNLSIIENGKTILNKRITVNDPLTHRGITFYQSSYQQIPGEYTVKLYRQKENDSGLVPIQLDNKIFTVKINEPARWDEAGVEFKIIASSKDGHGHGPYKIVFDDAKDDEISFIANDKQPHEIIRGTETYSFEIKQRFATGLQVAKDPGVWVVYIGCILMLFGLFVSFFMSHRRIWIAIQQQESDTKVVIKASTNKNSESLTRLRNKIEANILAAEPMAIRRI
jgi:cytochrome c biogenesis protein